MASQPSVAVDETIPFRNVNTSGLLLFDPGWSAEAETCRAVLVDKGTFFDVQHVDVLLMEHRNPKFLQVSPTGITPVLGHGDRVVCGAFAIAEYLDDMSPNSPIPLYPDDVYEYSEVCMWQARVQAFQQDFQPYLFQRLIGPMLRISFTQQELLDACRANNADEQDLEWIRKLWAVQVLPVDEEMMCLDRLQRWLQELEKQLKGKRYLVAGRFSMADLLVYPCVKQFSYVDMRVSKERFPAIAEWMERCGKRACFEQSGPACESSVKQLNKTPALSWLSKLLKKAEGEWSWHEKARLAVLKSVVGRMFGSIKNYGPGCEIMHPHVGRVPPSAFKVKPWRPLSPQQLQAPLTLYNYAWAPEARCVRIVLNEKQLKADIVDVDMSRMEHKGGSYLNVNPCGQLPALTHGDKTLYDSGLIAVYLDRLFPSSDQLFPEDAYACAQVRMWAALDARLSVEFRPLFYLFVIRPMLVSQGKSESDVDGMVPEDAHPTHKTWLRDVLKRSPRLELQAEAGRLSILRQISVVEDRLNRARYLTGDTMSYADIVLFARIDAFPSINIDLDAQAYPGITRWLGEMRSRPSVQSA